MVDIVACGGVVMDLIVNIKQAPLPNAACDVQGMSWQYGGKIATGIVAAARLSGRPCAVMGAVGGEIGQLIKRDFLRHNVDCSCLLERAQGQSQLCLVMSIEDDQSRNFYTQRQTIDVLAAEEVDEGMIGGAQYLLLSDPRPYSVRAARIARAHGVKVVYDADRYYEEGMETILKEVDYLVPSEYCYETLFGTEGSVQDNLVKLRDMAAPGARVIVTFGERGLSGLDEEGFFEMPAFKVDVVDTTGAGDVFHGALIAGLIRGMALREAARFASAAAAIKCTRIGGRAGIPDYEVTKGFLETGDIDYCDIDRNVAYYARMPML